KPSRVSRWHFSFEGPGRVSAHPETILWDDAEGRVRFRAAVSFRLKMFVPMSGGGREGRPAAALLPFCRQRWTREDRKALNGTKDFLLQSGGRPTIDPGTRDRCSASPRSVSSEHQIRR